MTSISRTISVDRPTVPVARYLSDFATSAVWDPHTLSCRRVDAGPLRVGSQYDVVAQIGPRRENISYLVTAYEPGRRLVVEGRSTMVRLRDELTFTATSDGAGTDVTYAVEVELLGRARFGTPLVAAAMASVADRGTETLRRTLLEVVPPPHEE